MSAIFNEYTVALEQEDDLGSVSWYDCPDCNRAVRDGEACRRCGPLSRMLERIASIQRQCQLHLSLAKETGVVSYVDDANRLARWARVWVTAAQELEARLVADASYVVR